MFNRGLVYIIPDENKILEECFFEVVQEEYHLSAIQKFCDKYKLGYKFDNGQSNDAPCYLALDGHFVIKTDEQESWLILYIPKVITKRQAEWFLNNINKFEKYDYVTGGIVDGDKENIVIIDEFDDKKINNLEMLRIYFNRKWISYSSKNHGR